MRAITFPKTSDGVWTNRETGIIVRLELDGSGYRPMRPTPHGTWIGISLATRTLSEAKARAAVYVRDSFRRTITDAHDEAIAEHIDYADRVGLTATEREQAQARICLRVDGLHVGHMSAVGTECREEQHAVIDSDVEGTCTKAYDWTTPHPFECDQASVKQAIAADTDGDDEYERCGAYANDPVHNSISPSVAHQDRAGMSGSPVREFNGEQLLACPKHPDTSAVDCTECVPVDHEDEAEADRPTHFGSDYLLPVCEVANEEPTTVAFVPADVTCPVCLAWIARHPDEVQRFATAPSPFNDDRGDRPIGFVEQGGVVTEFKTTAHLTDDVVARQLAVYAHVMPTWGPTFDESGSVGGTTGSGKNPALPPAPADLNDDPAWQAYIAALPVPPTEQYAAVLAEFGDPYAEQVADCRAAFRTAARTIWRGRAQGTLTDESYRRNREAMRVARECLTVYRNLTAAWARRNAEQFATVGEPDPREVARACLPRGGNLGNLSNYSPRTA